LFSSHAFVELSTIKTFTYSFWIYCFFGRTDCIFCFISTDCIFCFISTDCIFCFISTDYIFSFISRNQLCAL